MTNPHSNHRAGRDEQQTLNRSKPVFVGFLLAAAYFLFTEHRAHVIAFLPYLLLLACPLMHIFMHGSHGGHGKPMHAENQAQSAQEER